MRILIKFLLFDIKDFFFNCRRGCDEGVHHQPPQAPPRYWLQVPRSPCRQGNSWRGIEKWSSELPVPFYLYNPPPTSSPLGWYPLWEGDRGATPSSMTVCQTVRTSRRLWWSDLAAGQQGCVEPNTFNLDLDPEFWSNLDPDPSWIQGFVVKLK